MNGQKLEFHWGLPVDCAGELPDGRPFKDVRELKKLLVQRSSGPGAKPGPAALHLRHRRAGAFFRSRGNRSESLSVPKPANMAFGR